MTAKDAKNTGTFESLVQQDFQHNRIPFLAQVRCSLSGSALAAPMMCACGFATTDVLSFSMPS